MGCKANLTGKILPVSTALTVVTKPLWVLTGSVTGAVVSTAGVMVVSGASVATGRVCCTGGSDGGGGGGGRVGCGFVGHGPLSL